MRLSQDCVQIIKNAAREFFGDSPIWLFGSRVDDNKRGGDIDLFIEANQEYPYQNQLKFCARLERKGIERKVDLIVKSPNSNHRSIFDTAKKEGVLL